MTNTITLTVPGRVYILDYSVNALADAERAEDTKEAAK